MSVRKYRCKIWCKFPDCGTKTSVDREWWWVFPTGLWLVAVIPYSFWMAAWMVAPVSWRLFGTMEACMPRARKMILEKCRTFKCHGTIWQTFVVPNFAIPNVACS